MDMDPSNDVKIVLGGGHKCQNWTRKRILHNYRGQHSLQNTSNENGKPLIGFAQVKNMMIRSTEFLQKGAKATWVFPDGQAKNQTDHIIMDRKQDKHQICKDL